MDLNKYCLAAKIYLGIALFTIAIKIFAYMTKSAEFNSTNAIKLFLQILFTFLFFWFMNFLCKKGYRIIAWIIAGINIVATVGTLIFTLLGLIEIKSGKFQVKPTTVPVTTTAASAATLMRRPIIIVRPAHEYALDPYQKRRPMVYSPTV